MKKIIAAIAASAVLAIGMAAPVQADTPTSTVAAAPTWTKKDRQFVRILRAEYPMFKYIPARDLIENARLTCKALRTGSASVIDIVEIAVESGFSEDEGIALLAGAITFYCPEQGDYL